MTEFYRGVLKILGVLSLAFCCLIMIPRIIEVASDRSSYRSSLIWELLFITLLIIILSYLVIRYSKFLAEKFDHLNKLALFLSISILAVILTPFIPGYAIGSFLYLTTVMLVFGITSILISSSLTYLGTKLNNQFISWLLSVIFGLCSFFIFLLLSGLAYRHIGGGHGTIGFALIVFGYGISITIISIIVNLFIKADSTKIDKQH